MTLLRTAQDVVPGDLAALDRAASSYRRCAAAVDAASRDLVATVSRTGEVWRGEAADGFRTAVGARAGSLSPVVALAGDAASAHESLAASLRALRGRAQRVLDRSTAVGLPPGALTSDPWSVARAVLARPQIADDVVRLLAEVVEIRLEVNAAHDAFVVGVGAVSTSLASRDRDRRSPDERGGRRIRNDDLTRRGEPGSDHLSNDWAGRAILERYLRGGGDWDVDDPEWAEYMKANETLRTDLAGRTSTVAQDALAQYLASGRQSGSFDTTFSASIENGEGIVGYQYLHGTNAEVGGFQHSGTTKVTPLPDGTFRVEVVADYVWNDVIDPNPQYSTDRWKSKLAEILTLGQADPYDIHIRWDSSTTVVVDAQGNVVSVDGYPG